MGFKFTTGRLLAAGSMAVMVVMAAAAAAHADEIGVFQASGMFNDPGGSALTGTMDIDETTGVIVSDSLSVTAIGALSPTIFSQGYSTLFADYAVVNYAPGSTTDYLDTGILAASLVGYGGGPLASLADISPNAFVTSLVYGGGDYALTAGSLTLESTFNSVPEPSTWALALAAAALTGAALRRRRTGWKINAA